MNKINKFFERLSRFFRFFISDNYKLNKKYQNKNQVTNAELILNLLKIGFIAFSAPDKEKEFLPETRSIFFELFSKMNLKDMLYLDLSEAT